MSMQIRWKEYVPVAWQVDPALALSLQDHFPANTDVKQALEQLVVEHAHAAKVSGGPPKYVPNKVQPVPA